MTDTQETTSTRPYLIRALYEWCTDNGYTPFIAVLVDDTVRVPFEFVKDGEIVLNISFDATSALNLGNEFIEFKGRFGGVARDIFVPVDRVLAIYARENGQGMAFPTAANAGTGSQGLHAATGKPGALQSVSSSDDSTEPTTPSPSGRAKPALKRIK